MFACGSRHVLALGSDGQVYSWGFGGDGQLGHGDLEIQTSPRLIKALSFEGVREICAGENHSVALTAGGTRLRSQRLRMRDHHRGITWPLRV